MRAFMRMAGDQAVHPVPLAVTQTVLLHATDEHPEIFRRSNSWSRLAKTHAPNEERRLIGSHAPERAKPGGLARRQYIL